jgi:hypothetical protein
MGSGRYVDHDECLGKIKSLAKATDYEKKEKKDYVAPPEEKKCTNCNIAKNCRKFKGKTAYDGTYSVGGDSDNTTICDKWKPKEDKVKVMQNTKSLLKQFTKQANRKKRN